MLLRLREIYGDDRVAGVATFGTEGSRSSIQTAARGLNLDPEEAAFISSLIPVDRGAVRTLDQAYYGDENEGFKPIPTFVQVMDANPDLWKIAKKIEGLVCRLGSHAGGVIFVDEPFQRTTSIMTTPDGLAVVGYELHTAEKASLIKYDLLSIEALDKIHICLDLLVKNNLIEQRPTLKETYESVISIYDLERTAPNMWEMIHNKKILSLFQMEAQSGIQAISLAKPNSVDDLAVLNAVLRLMAPDKNSEQPLNKFARYKKDITLWYKEMSDYGLTQEEQELLKPWLELSSGICCMQELFMVLVQIPECGGFDLEFSDRLRKSIAKKKPKEYEQLTEEYFKVVEEKGLSKNLCNYVWNVLIAMNRSYGFNSSHTLAYSLIALQEMNLCYKYPIIYWNTACLITDSGGSESDDKNADYAKIAKAIGKIKEAGIQVYPPDINKSSYTFTPDEANDRIMYGLKGITRVGEDIVQKILENRPFTSLEDFYERVKPNKLAMVNLIKGGAFDSLMDRTEAMKKFIWMTCDSKKRITLQNMPMLLKLNLIPQDTEELKRGIRFYSFNRYLKANCKFSDTSYLLDEKTINFLDRYGYLDILLLEEQKIKIKDWDKVYKKEMEVFKAYFKVNGENLLNKLNQTLFDADWEKYATGNLSSWEMDSLCFYYHEHELAHINTYKYGLSEYFDLPEEPVIEKTFRKGEHLIPIYRLNKIYGTCIAKDDTKSTIYLLTPKGVCPVKFRKEYYAMFNRRLFKRNPDGTKTITENSWFNRGVKLVIQGIRRGDTFIPKKYASTNSEQIYIIDEVKSNGDISLRHTRIGEEAEDEE